MLSEQAALRYGIHHTLLPFAYLLDVAHSYSKNLSAPKKGTADCPGYTKNKCDLFGSLYI